MATQETQQQLADMVRDARAQVKALRKACMDFADAHGLAFVWDTTYGAREQTYHGRGAKNERWSDSGCSWESSEEEYLSDGKWTSSSEDC